MMFGRVDSGFVAALWLRLIISPVMLDTAMRKRIII